MSEELLMNKPGAMQSPLVQIDFAQVATAKEVLEIKELAFRGHVNLRGSTANPTFMSAVQAVLGTVLPTANNTFVTNADYTVLWYGPDEWLILTPPAQGAALVDSLRGCLEGVFSAVTDISGGNTILEISGSAAADLLAKGCPLDLHAAVFAEGQCAQTVLAKTSIGLLKANSSQYRLIVRRSFADYLGLWLIDAAREFAETGA